MDIYPQLDKFTIHIIVDINYYIIYKNTLAWLTD